MIKRRIHLLISFAIACFILSCEDNEHISTNSNHLLTFSKDTLQLDTVFTGIGTSTHIIKVYNRNKQALNITSVTLANASESGFRINVDGQKGTHFTDVEIAGKDSLHLFIEAAIKDRDEDLPFQVKDSIVFLTNGVKQDIKLLAYGQHAVVFRGKVIEQDTIITSRRPLLVYDSICVAEHATLTLEPGVRIFFHAKTGMKVYGRLLAQGTIASPVIFRGDRTDNMFADLPYDRLPGQWEGVRFDAASYGNVLNYVDIRGGNYGVQCDPSQTDRQKLTITNSRITQVYGDAVAMVNCKAKVANSEISNAGTHCVHLLGGDYEFIHCTLANYYSWNVRKGVALAMGNEENGTEYPLQLASFRNCVIAGLSADEIAGRKSADELIPYNYYFSHCLIHSKEESNNRMVGVVWAKDDNFVLLDRSTQLYDFRLEATSEAVNIGLLQDAVNYPTDRNGISRVSDEAPDAGCYEWVEK